MANEKDILYTRTCSLCRNKLKLLDRHYLHMLSDGTLCQTCNMTILQLLSERHCWVSEEEYMQVMQKSTISGSIIVFLLKRRRICLRCVIAYAADSWKPLI